MFVTIFLAIQLYASYYLFQYFPHKEYLEAYNPESNAKVGDIVLIKKLDSLRRHVETHKVSEIVYNAGFIIDPMTGIRVNQDRWDMIKLNYDCDINFITFTYFLVNHNC